VSDGAPFIPAANTLAYSSGTKPKSLTTVSPGGDGLDGDGLRQVVDPLFDVGVDVADDLLHRILTQNKLDRFPRFSFFLRKNVSKATLH
jgi:hypothetical protein